MHLGIDVGILSSLDVRAAAGGTVSAAGWLTGYEGTATSSRSTSEAATRCSTRTSRRRTSFRASGSWPENRSARPAAPAPAPARTCTSSSAATACRSIRPPSSARPSPPNGGRDLRSPRPTLSAAHDTDAPIAERARRLPRRSRRRLTGLGSPGRPRAAPVRLARRRHGHVALRRLAWRPPPRGHRHRHPPDVAAACGRGGHRPRSRATPPATRATARSSCSTSPGPSAPSTPISRTSASGRRPRREGRAARARRVHGQLLGNASALRAEARRRRGRPDSLPRLESPAARAVSSVGRAPARQAGGHWFEPSTAHFGPHGYRVTA